MVIRTKSKETSVIALHFKSVNFLLPVTIPISVELVRHNVGILCLNFGELASGWQLMCRFRTELYFSRQTWIQYMWINLAMLLQVLHLLSSLLDRVLWVLWVHLPTVVVQVGFGAGTMVAWRTMTALEHWVLWVHLPTVVVQVGFGAGTMVAWRTSWKYITGI